MYLDYTDDQKALRDELRAYFDALMTEDLRAELHPGHGGERFRKVVRQLGMDGWLGLGWPTEYGGQGRPATDQFIFYTEAMRAGAPIPFVTLNTVGPTLMTYGTDQQKADLLPGILAGELHFAIGYTEPEAGTDLASLRTRAVRDGDEYVVNGNKVFTSGAEDADYIWLACRTDPEAKPHRGISLLLVPTGAAGFSFTPIHTVGDGGTTSTYYDDVVVPVTNRIGDENDGWRMITAQLNHERVALASWGGQAHALYDGVLEWAATTEAHAGADAAGPGSKVIDLPWVQLDLARAGAQLEAMKLINWRLVADAASGDIEPAEASSAKVFGSETVIEVYRLLRGVLGVVSYTRPGSPGAVLRGRLERSGRHAIVNTFGGGVNEVQREIVAWMGLDMTRASRR